jgi:hypothetical protein
MGALPLNYDHSFGFHSLVSFCASATCAAVILPASSYSSTSACLLLSIDQDWKRPRKLCSRGRLPFVNATVPVTLA